MELAESIIALVGSLIALGTSIAALFTIRKANSYLQVNQTQINNYNDYAKKFVKICDESDLKKRGDRYYIEIPKTEHGIENPFVVKIYEIGDNKIEECVVSPIIQNDATIIINSDVCKRFKVFIM